MHICRHDSINVDMLIAARAVARKTRGGEATVEALEQALAVFRDPVDRILDRQRALEEHQHALERQIAATLSALMTVRAL